MGKAFLKCPTFKPGNKYYTGTENFSYGANFWYATSQELAGFFYSGPPTVSTNFIVKLDRLPKDTYLIADAYAEFITSPLYMLYNPYEFSFNQDLDGDGINESNTSYTSWGYPMLGLCCRHNGFANFLFVDGSVKALRSRDWATQTNMSW